MYILLYPQEEEVYSSSWGHEYIIHIQQHNHQKDLNPCLSLYYYGKVIVELEKNTNKEFNCVYGVCNMTKWHFEILICFWFQLIFEQSFPYGIASKHLSSHLTDFVH